MGSSRVLLKSVQRVVEAVSRHTSTGSRESAEIDITAKDNIAFEHMRRKVEPPFAGVTRLLAS